MRYKYNIIPVHNTYVKYSVIFIDVLIIIVRNNT